MKKKQLRVNDVPGRITSTANAVILEIYASGVVLQLEFTDPAQLMSLLLLAIEEMVKVFPDFEASKLWLDDTF